MASYNFSNYSFSNSLKSLTDPFRQLIKKPAATSTPSALFTPAPKAPVTPSLNYSPYTPAPNMSTATGPKYAPSITTTPTPIAPKPPVSAPTPPLNPAVPQIAPTAIPTAPPVAPGTQESAPGATSDQVSPETTKALGLAESAYQRSLQISPEELSTQEDLDKLIESTKTAYRNTSGQAIPMEFITGQLRSIEQRATGLAEPLERKLSRLQAARTSSLEASKFALERADKSIQSEKDASKPVAGTSFYDPRTGKFTQAPAAIPKADPFTLSPGDKRYDDKGNLIASGGEKPMSDAAEAKLIEKAAEKTEKEESSRQAATLSIGAVNNLLSGDRYKAIAGVVQTGSIPFFGDRAAVAEYKQLKASLALGARSLIKGSGAVSDFEARMLQEASSALSRTTNEGQMKQALQTVRGVLKTNNGQETEVIIKDKNGKVLGKGSLNGQDIYDAVNDGNTIEYL